MELIPHSEFEVLSCWMHLCEIKHVDIVRHERSSVARVFWAGSWLDLLASFELDSGREGDVFLNDGEKPGNTVTLGSSREKSQNYSKGITTCISTD